MLAEICRFLRNWFEVDKYFATFTISDGTVKFSNGSAVPILSGQYFRIVGSVFNDGIYSNPTKAGALVDEVFTGAVWALAIPKEILEISDEIDEWVTTYGGAKSEANSPYSSESFAGYSYSKASQSGSDGALDASAGDWRSVYASRLREWRKI